MEVIKTVDINFTYPDGTTALTDINLSVASGERVAVLGANGSGKSTLFNLFNGLLQPTSGEVFIKDLPVEKKNYKAIRRMVGMVFQDPDDQLFSNTVKQEIAYGLLNLGTPREEIPEAVRWALERGWPGQATRTRAPTCSAGARKSGWPWPACWP